MITEKQMKNIIFITGFLLYSVSLVGIGYYSQPPKVEVVKEKCARLPYSAYECVIAHKELGYTKLFTGLNCREAVEEAYQKGQRTFSPESIK